MSDLSRQENRQVVDPFVVAPPAPEPVSDDLPHPSASIAARLRRVTPTAPVEHKEPLSTVDGMLVVEPALQPTIEPAPKPRPLPAGPLHLKYRTTPLRDVEAEAAETLAPLRRPIPARPPVQLPAAQLITPRPPGHARVNPPARATASNSGISQEEQRIIDAIIAGPPAKSTVGQKARKAAKVSGWAILGALVISGLSLFSMEVGEVALAIYGIVALWRRWESQQTFALALAMFGGIILSSLLTSLNIPRLDSVQQISENLAVYAFLLLCIGTVALAREVRQDSRQAALD